MPTTHRTVLEESEHALAKLRQISQAAVSYRKSNATYGKFIDSVSCIEKVDEVLLSGLASLAPDYMVLSKLVVLPKLSKNQNGKVDRHLLLTMLDD